MRRWPFLCGLAVLAALVAWWTGSRRGLGGGSGADEERPAPATDGAMLGPAGVTPPRVDSREGGGEPVRDLPTLAGRVLDATTRQPIAGADVSAFGYEDLRRLRTPTRVDGVFRFPETAGRRGAFHVVIAAEGYGRFVDVAARTSVEPRTILLGAEGTIEGRLVEAADESAVPRFRVLALRRPERFTEDRSLRDAMPEEQAVDAAVAVDDAQGRFEVRGLSPGTYALVFLVEDRHPFFWSGGKREYDSTGFPVAAGVSTDAGTVRLPHTGSVVVRVLDAATERPLPGASFEANLRVDERTVRLPLRPLEVRGASDYVLALPFDGAHRLDVAEVAVTVSGYAPGSTGGSGHAAGEVFVVRLAAPASLTGTVRGGEKDGAGRLVLVRRAVDRAAVATVTTDVDGAFSIADLPPGIDLEALAFERAADRVLLVTSVRLNPGETRVLHLLGPDATGVEGRVRIDGKPVARGFVVLDVGDHRLRSPIDEDGGFRFEAIPAGAHSLFANLDLAGADGAYLGRTVTVEEGRMTAVTIDLSGAVRGRLSARRGDGSAADVAAKSIVARPATAAGDAAAWTPETRTGADGSFTLRLPGPGPWLVDVDEQDLFLAEGPARVDLTRARDPAEPVDLRATVDPQDGRIEIDVRDAESGDVISEKHYRWSWRFTVAGGTIQDSAPVVLEQAGLGTYRFVIEADHHVSVPVDVDVTPARRTVKTRVALPRSDAVRLTAIDAAAQAGAVGLRVGDLVLRYADARVRDVGELSAAVKATSPSDVVRLEIVRDGSAQVLTARGGRLGVEAENARAGR